MDIDNDARRNGTPDFVTDIGADRFDGTGSGLGVWRRVNSGGMMYKTGAALCHCKYKRIHTGRKAFLSIDHHGNAKEQRNISIAAGGTVTITGVGKLITYMVLSPTAELLMYPMVCWVLQDHPHKLSRQLHSTGNNIKNLVVNTSDTVKLAGNLNLLNKLSFKAITENLPAGSLH